MIVIDHVILSDDIAESFFVCDLSRCKGACCEEGDLGAPLDIKEIQALSNNYTSIAPYLTDAAKEIIEKEGLFIEDFEGDYSTPTVSGRECVYSIRENGILKCGIEKAWKEGKSDFQKPISCHLYPIRISKHDEFEAVNYHRWQICSPACSLGERLKIPLYIFLKEALIRKYGSLWYQKLVEEIEAKKNP